MTYQNIKKQSLINRNTKTTTAQEVENTKISPSFFEEM